MDIIELIEEKRNKINTLLEKKDKNISVTFKHNYIEVGILERDLEIPREFNAYNIKNTYIFDTYKHTIKFLDDFYKNIKN